MRSGTPYSSREPDVLCVQNVRNLAGLSRVSVGFGRNKVERDSLKRRPHLGATVFTAGLTQAEFYARGTRNALPSSLALGGYRFNRRVLGTSLF